MIFPSLLSFVKKLTILSIIGSILFVTAIEPMQTFAQALPENPSQTPPSGSLFPQGGSIENPAFPIEDSQAKTIQSGQSTKSTPERQQQIYDLAVEGLSCSAATILGQVLASAISAALSEIITSVVEDKAKEVVEGAIKDPVPTLEQPGPLVSKTSRILDNAKLSNHAEKGVAGPFGIYINVSWDSIAWCVVNAMIEHIANATIAWANSGFNGNPAFLENPERFFRDLADYQAGAIIKDIAYGATGGAVNVCQPFKVTIAVGLAQSYPGYGQNALNSQYRGMSCRLSEITQKKLYGGVAAGAPTWTEWGQMTQNDQNNPMGAYILANRTLYTTVAAKNNELRLEIGMNNGWLNFKKCPEGEKDPNKCETTTPGRLIEAQLNSTLDQSKQRLVMATKFDQMITAIVNNLIKVALNKILEEANK